MSGEEAEVCLPVLTQNFHSGIHTGSTCAPHVYRPVRPVVGTPSEKAALGLRPTLGWRSLTRIAGPLLLPRRLLHGWVMPETAEGQQNQHVRKGCRGEKKYSGDIDFRKGSANAARSQMCDHIYACEIVPVIL